MTEQFPQFVAGLDNYFWCRFCVTNRYGYRPPDDATCWICSERRYCLKWCVSLPMIEKCVFNNGDVECDLSILNQLYKSLRLIIISYLYFRSECKLIST